MMQFSSLLSDKSNYTAGRRAQIKYIVVHYTGNKNDTAANNAKYFQGPNRGASAHYFVDATGVYKTVNNQDTAWHCGAKSYRHPICRNSNSLGVELCSNYANGKFYFSEQTIKNALELIKQLMKAYGIPEQNVVRHYDVTGKLCPAPFINEKDWSEFKKLLKD